MNSMRLEYDRELQGVGTAHTSSQTSIQRLNIDVTSAILLSVMDIFSISNFL